MGVAKEFRDFILRGNVVDLAVGVIIGASFGAVVTALVKDIITPLISIPGTQNFSELYWQVGGAKFLYGDFINALISFLAISFIIFFFVVKPVNILMKRFKPATPEPETTHECPFCLSKVPLKATRCAYCTSELQAGTEPILQGIKP